MFYPKCNSVLLGRGGEGGNGISFCPKTDLCFTSTATMEFRFDLFCERPIFKYRLFFFNLTAFILQMLLKCVTYNDVGAKAFF